MLGELLGAAGSLLGGIFGQSSADKANALQKEAAQKSVQWRVADAKAAGIHPLAALGMSPISLSPVAVGDTGGLADAGQSVGRAIEAGSTSGQRASSLATEVTRTQREGLKIDNDIKRAELASRVRRSLVGAGVAPPVPGPNTARGADIGGQTIPLPGGKVVTTGRTGTSEEIERQYGDVVQNVYGIGRMVDDAANNVAPGVNWDRYHLGNVLHELLGVNPAY